MLKIKKWRRVTHEETGISVEVGRLSYSQAPFLAMMTAEVFSAAARLVGDDGKPKPGITATDQSATLREAYGKFDHEMIARMFRDKVRNVEGIEDEDGPAKTGPALLELADQSILVWVLRELVKTNQMSEEEGKASGSPSTSSSSDGANTGSAAESIEPAAGTTPSTATETPSEGESSIQVA